MMDLEIQARLLPSETEAKSALCQGNMMMGNVRKGCVPEIPCTCLHLGEEIGKVWAEVRS